MEEISKYYRCLSDCMTEASGLSCKDAMKRIYEFVLKYFGEGKRLRFWRILPFIPDETLKSTFVQLINSSDERFRRDMEECFLKGIEKGEIRQDASLGSLHLYLCMVQGVLDGMLLYSKMPEDTEGMFEAYWKGICSKY